MTASEEQASAEENTKNRQVHVRFPLPSHFTDGPCLSLGTPFLDLEVLIIRILHEYRVDLKPRRELEGTAGKKEHSKTKGIAASSASNRWRLYLDGASNGVDLWILVETVNDR